MSQAIIVEHRIRPPLTGRALKVTIVLAAAELLAHPVPETGRVVLRIRAGDRSVTADIAAKSLRRAQTAIRENGAENVACIIQGKLSADNSIIEAGLVAQPRLKAATEAAPAESPRT